MCIMFAIINFVFILGLYIGIILGTPVITPNETEYIISSGDNFVLTCKSESPVSWTYPIYHNITDQKFEVVQSYIDGTHVSELKITNASDLAVGFYYCNETGNPDQYAHLYLYVEDDNVLYVGRKEVIPAEGKQYAPLVIPCKPTSPNVVVKLFNGVSDDADREVRIVLPGNDSSFWTYSRLYGFTLSYVLEPQVLTYTCSFYKENSSYSTVTVIASVGKVHSHVPEPIINRIGHESYAVEEKDLVLKCQVQLEASQTVDFSWSLNNVSITENKRIHIKREHFSQIESSSILTILNATKSRDEGNYICKVDDSDNVSHGSLYVSILRKGTHFLELSETNNILNVTCRPGECIDVTWNINVTSYPNPDITWIGNNFTKIVNNSKYIITNTNKGSILVIRNVTIKERGNFTIKASNKFHTKSLYLFLDVRDKPHVQLENNNFHIAGSKEKVECLVQGYPKPQIEWMFKSCLDNTCDFETISGSDPVTKGLYFVSTTEIQATKSGYIKCFAANYFGQAVVISNYIVTDVKDGFRVEVIENDIELPQPLPKIIRLAVNDTVTFKCSAATHNYSSIQWYYNNTLLGPDGEYQLESSSTQYSLRKSFTMKTIKFDFGGEYKCKAEKKFGRGFEEFEARVKVIMPGKPSVTSTNMQKKPVEIIYPGKHNFTCNYDGVPRPTIAWYKDNQEIIADNDRIIYDNDKQMLLFTRTKDTDEGNYACVIENRVGSISQTSTLVITNKNTISFYIYIALAVVIVLFFVLFGYLAYRIRREKEIQRVLKLAGLYNFEKGAPECINPDLGIDDQAELLPYDKDSWEIPRDHIKLGKQLGAGAFGVVMKAILESYLDSEPMTVAVKMVKKNADDSYLRALVSELKIMVHLGKHLNVVNLIGACTKNIAKRELYVVVEYCRFGNLHNYLLRHRENFINQIDPITGKIDYNIGLDILSRSFSVSSNRSQEGPPKDMMDYRGQSNYHGTTQNTEVTLISMSPSGSQGDEALMSNNSVQPEWRTNYKGDYKGNVKPICTKDLITWAFQVSRGMEYLASRKILHGDLAARNILLADESVVKICDFGLAKSMYKNDNYKKKSDGPLPIKWMPVESIRDKVFSTQSDVWSFGIVLWEFFSLAKTPYPGMEADERLFQKLVDGYRMDSPTYATKEIYTIMLNCWEPKPLNRPSFTKLGERFGEMLEESVKKHYIDLNDPYLVMNTERFQQGGHSDYLQMVSPPDFEKLSSPHYINDANIPRTATVTSDYMLMKPGHIFSPRSTDGEIFTFSELNNKDPTMTIMPTSPELTPMLKHDSDYETQPNTPKSPDLPSYANPTYNKIDFLKDKQNIIVNAPDNYVNMPKNKSALKFDKDDFVNDDERHYVNDVSRDWEKV